MRTLTLKQLTKARQQGLKQYTKNILLGISIVLLSGNNILAQTCNSHISPSTPTSRFIPQGDGTVLDTQTNLIWERCMKGQTWNGASESCDGNASIYDGYYTWQEVLNVPQGNWRVPNIKELSSIVESSCYNPAINLTIFPNVSSGYVVVWSSSTYAGESNDAWFIDFSGGFNSYNFKSYRHQVRLVRSGQ